MEIKVDFGDNQKLLEAIKAVPGNVEEQLNEYLDHTGSKIMIEQIVGLIPKSNRPKQHAKDSDPITHKMMHLGFVIRTKPRFNYLVFPERGIGYTNPIAQKFFERGIDEGTNKLLNDVMRVLEDAAQLNL